MTDSIAGVGTPGFAAAYTRGQTEQAKEVLMLKKMQDNQEQQGQNAMKLLASAINVVSASKVDAHV